MRRTRAVLGWIVIAAPMLLAGVPAGADLQATFVDEVCRLPTSPNNGKMVGYDVGWSAVHNGVSYFFFGDAFIDRTGGTAGVIDYGCNGSLAAPCVSDAQCPSPQKCVLADKFSFGNHFARSTDTNAADCIGLEYLAQGGEGKRLLPADPCIHQEHVVWPAGGVSAGGNLYAYFRAFGPTPRGCSGNANRPCTSDAHCTAQDFCPNGNSCASDPRQRCCELGSLGPYRGTVLATIDNLQTFQNAHATRIEDMGAYFFASNEPKLSAPLKVNVGTPCGPVQYVFLFGTPETAGSSDVFLIRTTAAGIADRSTYRYWGVADGMETWVSSIFDATPIFTDAVNRVHNIFNVSYNSAIGRYLVIYSCGSGTNVIGHKLCAAYTLAGNTDPAALTSDWSIGQVIHDCEGTQFRSCYQGFLQSQYGTGSRVYVTAAKNIDREYHVALRAFDLLWNP